MNRRGLEELLGAGAARRGDGRGRARGAARPAVRRPRLRQARSSPRAPHRPAGGDLRRGQDASSRSPPSPSACVARRAERARHAPRRRARRGARRASLPALVYHPDARLAVLRGGAGRRRPATGIILVVSAGTADQPVAEEAACTAELVGNAVERLYDVGVAGLHRLLASRERLRAARVVIVVAGMEGALPSVVGGLVDVPVIAVPTSVGYGASFGGLAALLAMLNTCAAGRDRREHRQRLRCRRRGEPDQSSLSAPRAAPTPAHAARRLETPRARKRAAGARPAARDRSPPAAPAACSRSARSRPRSAAATSGRR